MDRHGAGPGPLPRPGRTRRRAIAPERLRGEADGPLADLWSLGATLYVAVEGRPPFTGSNEAAVLAAVLMREPDPFRLAGPLAPVLGAILAKEPARRCSPDKSAAWMDAISRGDDTAGAALPRLPAGPERPRRLGRGVQVLIAAALALTLTTAAAWVIVPRLFPNFIRVLGAALAPAPRYSYSPLPVATPTASPTPLITRDFDACDLLTSAQARSLFDEPVKRQFYTAQYCTWQGTNGTFVGAMVTRMPSASAARMNHEFQVKFMEEEPKRYAGTTVRKGPKVGDEAFSHTRAVPYFQVKLYETKISFRLSNVSVNMTVRARKRGYAIPDRAAKLIAAALKKYR